MEPKFKMDKGDIIHRGAVYTTNGHWLVRNDRTSLMPKALSKWIAEHTEGRYDFGELCLTRECANLDQLIKGHIHHDLSAYKKLKDRPIGVKFRNNMDEIMAYVFEAEDESFEIGVQPMYVPILRMGNCFARAPEKGKNDSLVWSAILITDGLSVSDTLIGLLMPVRIP